MKNDSHAIEEVMSGSLGNFMAVKEADVRLPTEVVRQRSYLVNRLIQTMAAKSLNCISFVYLCLEDKDKETKEKLKEENEPAFAYSENEGRDEQRCSCDNRSDVEIFR